ncbi:hypothetical protein DY000_02061883 [Brassica cretica]|uniref:Small EDRK-rich factor-like N-terminal domain-containing protein n=1 Tax=Brassica cretica TaxID=69181 RepID=A0ABQ7AQG2_BRACR|nr:hypothetical protein DY000_02061883 [Brassica cretica]
MCAVMENGVSKSTNTKKTGRQRRRVVIKGRHQARKEAAYLKEKGSRNRRRRDEDHAQHKMGNGYRDNRSVGNALKSFVLTLVSRNVKV